MAGYTTGTHVVIFLNYIKKIIWFFMSLLGVETGVPIIHHILVWDLLGIRKLLR